MTIIFVYGTLKRSGSNHTLLFRQEYLGDAQTVPGHTLYALGDYPGMVRSLNDAHGVKGELWSVDHECLQELDKLEGIDEGLYERAEVALLPNPIAPAAQTYFYLRPVGAGDAIGSTWPVKP